MAWGFIYMFRRTMAALEQMLLIGTGPAAGSPAELLGKMGVLRTPTVVGSLEGSGCHDVAAGRARLIPPGRGWLRWMGDDWDASLRYTSSILWWPRNPGGIIDRARPL